MTDLLIEDNFIIPPNLDNLLRSNGFTPHDVVQKYNDQTLGKTAIILKYYLNDNLGMLRQPEIDEYITNLVEYIAKQIQKNIKNIGRNLLRLTVLGEAVEDYIVANKGNELDNLIAGKSRFVLTAVEIDSIIRTVFGNIVIYTGSYIEIEQSQIQGNVKRISQELKEESQTIREQTAIILYFTLLDHLKSNGVESSKITTIANTISTTYLDGINSTTGGYLFDSQLLPDGNIDRNLTEYSRLSEIENDIVDAIINWTANSRNTILNSIIKLHTIISALETIKSDLGRQSTLSPEYLKIITHIEKLKPFYYAVDFYLTATLLEDAPDQLDEA